MIKLNEMIEDWSNDRIIAEWETQKGANFSTMPTEVLQYRKLVEMMQSDIAYYFKYFSVNASATKVNKSLERAIRRNKSMPVSHLQVPQSWLAHGYFSKKNLKQWINELKLRLQEIKKLLFEGTDAQGIWIPAIMNPRGFIHGLVRKYAETNQLSLDRVEFVCDIVAEKDAERCHCELTKKELAYRLTGIFLMGYHLHNQSLANSACPRENFEEIPAVKLIIKQINSSVVTQSNECYYCPLYHVCGLPPSACVEAVHENYICSLPLQIRHHHQ
ncbi:hypothetical protein IE077_002067, partial [Cardiosporidium cionae]